MKKRLINTILILMTIHCLSFGQGSEYCGPYSVKSPIVWDNINNRTINGVEITNPGGRCIKLTNCKNITIQNCKLGPSKNEGVYLYHCQNVTITNCSMESISTGVLADSCSGIQVNYNDVKNVTGPMPRGQMVQFGRVYGAHNSISYNAGENRLGQSSPEDEISLYMSNGTPEDPIKVIGNRIRGGGPSKSGGGIMCGDKGGSYILVQDNILVDPGQYGITISSGKHITIKNNKIFGRQQPFSNIGLSAWNQYPTDCSQNTIEYNEVNFTNKDGKINCLWNAGNCGVVNGWSTNHYNENLTSTILPVKITGRCKENSETKIKNAN